MKKHILCLASLLLVSVLTTSAETYYLLSKERKAITKNQASPPLPFNPMPELKVHQVVDDIWLIEDEPAKVEGQPELDAVGIQLALKIKLAREAAAKLVKEQPTPPAPFKRGPNYYNPNITGLGTMLRELEKTHPGISTNFSEAQKSGDVAKSPIIPDRSMVTDTWIKVPIEINPSSPTFKEDLRAWKAKNGFTDDNFTK